MMLLENTQWWTQRHKGHWAGEVLEMWAPNDHVERSDLAKRFFIAGWERERAERAKREKERGAGA
jgi:hypothetical protein